MLFEFCLEKMEGAELFVFSSIESHSLHFQTFEKEVISFLIKRWDYLFPQFVNKVLKHPYFSKLLLVILNSPLLSDQQVK